ncbi:hypothetical protein [Paenibacillus marinisediminis]
MERRDIWTHEHDELLKDTVLYHIQNGSTQLKAFKAVADKLHRTAAACGFRWNSDVRKKVEHEIRQAKASRIKNKMTSKSTRSILHHDLTIDSIVSHLSKVERILKEKDQLIEQLKGEIQDLKARSSNDDLNSLIAILKRAKDLGALDKSSKIS